MHANKKYYFFVQENTIAFLLTKMFNDFNLR